MDHLLEVSRIIDGALKGDRAKVLAYVEQLARKLRETGDAKAADRLAQTASQTKTSEVVPNIAGMPGRLPVDSESRFSLADEDWLSPAEVQVVLDSAVQQRIDEFLRHVRAAERLMAHRIDIAPSMLIHGAPGVGKTQLARHLAAQLCLPLITARADSLVSSFLGSTAKNIRVLFEHAKSRPCVLFLDELDSVAKLRDDHHELGELKRVVVSLLQNIDALSSETILLAATNHPHLLDPAVWRRFAYKLELRPPDADARGRMFKLFLGEFLGDEVAVHGFVAVSEGATGSDIRHACDTAIREAIIDERTAVSETDVLRALVHLRLGTRADFSRDDGPLVKAVRDLAPEVFTLKRLSALFGSSEPTLSRRLHSDDSHGQQRAKAPNQDRPHTGRGSSGKAPRR